MLSFFLPLFLFFLFSEEIPAPLSSTLFSLSRVSPSSALSSFSLLFLPHLSSSSTLCPASFSLLRARMCRAKGGGGKLNSSPPFFLLFLLSFSSLFHLFFFSLSLSISFSPSLSRFFSLSPLSLRIPFLLFLLSRFSLFPSLSLSRRKFRREERREEKPPSLSFSLPRSHLLPPSLPRFLLPLLFFSSSPLSCVLPLFLSFRKFFPSSALFSSRDGNNFRRERSFRLPSSAHFSPPSSPTFFLSASSPFLSLARARAHARAISLATKIIFIPRGASHSFLASPSPSSLPYVWARTRGRRKSRILNLFRTFLFLRSCARNFLSSSPYFLFLEKRE